jgi:hypothetical protein
MRWTVPHQGAASHNLGPDIPLNQRKLMGFTKTSGRRRNATVEKITSWATEEAHRLFRQHCTA